MQAVVPERLPSVYFQMCLPEGRLRLFQVLQSLQDHHRRHKHDGNAGPAASKAAPGRSTQAGRTYERRSADDDAAAAADAFEQDTAAMDVCAGGEADTLNSCDYDEVSTHRSSTPQQTKLSSQAVSDISAACRGFRLGSNGDAAVDLSGFSTSSTSKGGKGPHKSPAGWCGWFGRLFGCGPSAAAPATPARVMPSGCAFWQEFSASIHVMCLAEIKYAMMAQSVVGVPGVMTLLCNLSTTVDFGLDTVEQVGEINQTWLMEDTSVRKDALLVPCQLVQGPAANSLPKWYHNAACHGRVCCGSHASQCQCCLAAVGYEIASLSCHGWHQDVCCQVQEKRTRQGDNCMHSQSCDRGHTATYCPSIPQFVM